MALLPSRIALQPGETPCALIAEDRQVQLLRDALLGVLSVMAAVLLTIALNTSLERSLSGPGTGLIMTFIFLFGPLLIQRVLGPRPVYMLTTHRLILAEDDAIDLRQVRRIRVWWTSVSLQTDNRSVALKNLANPPAVARLIRDTLAR